VDRERQLAARRREVERVRTGVAHAKGLIERQREVPMASQDAAGSDSTGISAGRNTS
jgi:hypothetical protein